MYEFNFQAILADPTFLLLGLRNTLKLYIASLALGLVLGLVVGLVVVTRTGPFSTYRRRSSSRFSATRPCSSK